MSSSILIFIATNIWINNKNNNNSNHNIIFRKCMTNQVPEKRVYGSPETSFVYVPQTVISSYTAKEYVWEIASNAVRNLYGIHPVVYSNKQTRRIQSNTAQHNTTQHNTTQHNTTQHSTTQHSTAQYSTAQHNTTQHNTAQHSTTQHNTAQHSTAQHNTTQHNTT